MRNILFLCSGNYYRSRFAEYYFNHMAARDAIRWRAKSRGLTVDQPNDNLGAMSPEAIDGLVALSIALPDILPDPKQVTDSDFSAADLIIALKEAEHRPIIQARYPVWEEEVEFWQIHDLDVQTADEALPMLVQMVELLLEDLSEVAFA